MNQSTARRFGVGSDAGPVARCLAVAGWMAAVAAPVAGIAYLLFGTPGAIAALAAAALCLLGAMPPLLFAYWLRGPAFAMHQLGIGMFSRMALPLGLALVVRFQRPDLVAAGFLIYLVIFFCVGLTLDTAGLLAASQSPSADVHGAANANSKPS